MSLSTNLISGLSSGLDWRSIIDQLMAIEHRAVDLVEDQKTEYQSKLEIYQSINTKLLSFKTQAETLASSDAFNVFSSNMSTTSASYNASDFLSVSTSTSAAPGSHTVTMDSNSQTAQARQISSKNFTNYNTALGLSGELAINGRALKVEASDDLQDIRDLINNLNTGTNATGVTASITTVSSNNYRLVLTSDNTGEDAFTIFDASTTNILSTGLGFTDGTTSVKNYISSGFQSEAFSSSTQAVGSMLGLNDVLIGTGITMGNVSDIDINLSTDSLTDIATEINDESGGNVTASVVSTTDDDGVTTYRLKIENTTSYSDNNNVLQALGLIKGDQGSVAEVHQGDAALYNDTDVLLDSDNGGADLLSSINMTDLRIAAGTSADVAAGDTIRVTGTKSDGTTVTATGTVGGGGDFTTVSDFMTWLDTQFTGGGDPANAVTVRFDDGLIKITDDNAGDSQLSIMITANNNIGNGQLDFGTVSATTQGYTMETQTGQDAKITIDGTSIISSSNIIDDVIAGVTLNLLTVEDGSTVTLNVSRDFDTIKSSAQSLLDQYNDVMSDINAQFAYDEDTETGGLLQGDGTLHSVKSNLVDVVVSSITGLPATLNALSLTGITSDDDGQLSIDNDVFEYEFNNDFNALKRVFIAEGSTNDGDVLYMSHTNDTVAGEYDVDITTPASQAAVTGSQDLSGGIASNYSTITITQGSRTAAVVLDQSGTGSSINNIVDAVNSELDTAYTQNIMGNIKNTAGDATTAITNGTTWDDVWSNGATAGLLDDNSYEITFSGKKSNGTSVSGSYSITDAGDDTVQGLLSAIESAYNNEVSASIDTYGYLVVTDNTARNSSLSIAITGAESLDFGDVTTSNLVGGVRNTEISSGNAITKDTEWNDIDSNLVNNDFIYFSGHTATGEAVEGSYQILNVATNTVDGLLTAIESAYDAAYDSDVDAKIQDGRIVITDGTSNTTLGIEIFEPTGGGRTLDFGTVSGGVTGRYSMDVTASKDGSNNLVLTHDDYGSSKSFTVQVSDTDLGLTDNQTYSGVDVVGTINGEAATGSGQLLTGDGPPSAEVTTSVEGLSIKYTGTVATTGDEKVKITMGVAELFDRALYDITNMVDGYLDFKLESVTDRMNDLDDQIEDMEDRLDLKMERMVDRFVAMELALSRIQSISNWLTGQINAANSGWA
ncbi:flagellar filament capping protein FliD [Thermodesulfobacteriota bacterium]